MALKPGADAPDFELRSHRGGTVRLSDLRGTFPSSPTNEELHAVLRRLTYDSALGALRWKLEAGS